MCVCACVCLCVRACVCRPKIEKLPFKAKFKAFGDRFLKN